MENHPIPQDVTGFQFRLIGDMTVKQFGYLAGGAVLAYLLSQFFPPILFLNWILAISAFGAGAAFAFIPISGRPLDLMLTNFGKALFAPTQFVYSKNGGTLSFDSIVTAPPKQQVQKATHPTVQQPTKNLNAYLQSISSSTPQSALDQKEQAYFQTIQAGFGPVTTPKSPTPFARAEQAAAAPDTVPTTPIIQRPQITETPIPVSPPTVAPQPVNPTVRVISPSSLPQRKMPTLLTPEVPNLIIGLVKDSRGNILPNILVEIKDQDGNPIRAFKTSGVGQFASATPLPNGIYSMEFEDPKGAHTFNTLELSINGTIIQPLEIISTDAREELRQALFTQ